MNINLQSNIVFTWIGYFNFFFLIIAYTTNFYYAHLTRSIILSENLLINVSYAMLFIYLTKMLKYFEQKRSIVIAFSIYTGTLIIMPINDIAQTFIHNYTVSVIVGALSLFSLSFLAIKIFTISDEVVSRYYKVLVLLIVGTTLVRIIPTVSRFLAIAHYTSRLPHAVTLYFSLFNLCLPVYIISIFIKTRPLLLTNNLPFNEVEDDL